MQETPVAGVPVVFGVATVVTDEKGEFIASVNTQLDASVSSGMKAVKFERFNGETRETLAGTGQQIADFTAARGGKLEIDAKALIRPGPLCKTFNVADGAEALRFPYSNREGETLEVASEKLNSLSSITGNPYPPSEFKATDQNLRDGYYGFEWPAIDFIWRDGAQQERIAASWQLLGQVVSVDLPREEVPLCTDLGEFRGCNRVTDEAGEKIFQQAALSVRTLNNELTNLLSKQKVKGTGKLRGAYLKNAGDSLRLIRQELRALPQQRFICTGELQMQCAERNYPKKEMLAYFDRIAKFNMAGTIKGFRRLHANLRKDFKKLVDKQPSRFVSCGN